MSRHNPRASLQFQALTTQQFSAITARARILEQDVNGPKVYQLPDGHMLKLFRLKRWWSRARLNPYSRRFWLNAERLTVLGIPTVRPLALYRLPTPGWTAVLYDPLPGLVLRQFVKDVADPVEIWRQLGYFVSRLHESGIYFRSLHLGNIVLTPTGEMGLIDVADLKIRKRALGAHKRLRNLRHLCRLKQDRAQIGEVGWDMFCRTYFEASQPALRFGRMLSYKIRHLMQSFA